MSRQACRQHILVSNNHLLRASLGSRLLFQKGNFKSEIKNQEIKSFLSSAFSHSAITRDSTSFSKFPLPERLAVFCTLIRDESDNDEGNN